LAWQELVTGIVCAPRSVVLLAMVAFRCLVSLFAVQALSEECDSGADVTGLLQHPAPRGSLLQARKLAEAIEKEDRSTLESNMPNFMAQMGLDVALAMLQEQVASVDEAADSTDAYLSGMIGAVPFREHGHILKKASQSMTDLSDAIESELEKGGAQTKMVLGMTGLGKSMKAYEGAVKEAHVVLADLKESCTALDEAAKAELSDVLSECKSAGNDFKTVYPEIMENFLQTLGQELLSNVADKYSLQRYIDSKMPTTINVVKGMSSKVDKVVADMVSDLQSKS